MDLLMFHLDKVNWVGVLVATAASFLVGSVWYTPAVFGKPWMKAVGLKPKDMAGVNMAPMLGLVGLLAFVLATGLAVLMSALDFTTWQQGLLFGALMSLAFGATVRGIHALFEQSGMTLFLINVGHDLVFLALAGVIIGLF